MTTKTPTPTSPPVCMLASSYKKRSRSMCGQDFPPSGVILWKHVTCEPCLEARDRIRGYTREDLAWAT